MAAPQGYSSLGVIGFTDHGTYDNSATYYINDLVHYLGNIYRCKVDGTSGIAPAENVNWTVFVGTPTNIVEELIAPVEVSPSANAYTAGRQFIYNDQLYEVVKAIAVGDSLVNISNDPSGNIKDADRVETQVLQTRKMIAPIEESPSINAYSVGNQLIYNGLLYNVTAAIAIGDSLAVGTNISLSDTVVDQLKTINTTLGDTDISGVGNSITSAISSLNTVETIDITSQLTSPLTDYSETFSVILAKCGNTISLIIEVHNYTGPTPGSYGTVSIGCLPEEYRPAINSFGFAGVQEYDAKFMVEVMTDGYIQIWRWGQPTSIASGSAIIATVTYIAAS